MTLQDHAAHQGQEQGANQTLTLKSITPKLLCYVTPGSKTFMPLVVESFRE